MLQIRWELVGKSLDGWNGGGELIFLNLDYDNARLIFVVVGRINLYSLAVPPLPSSASI